MMTVKEYETSITPLRIKLMSIAERYFSDGGEVEDIVQDALMKLWVMREQLSLPIDNFANLLVRNLCVDFIRRHKNISNVPVIDIVEPDVDDIKQDRVERMMTVINSLPDAQQILLRLRHLEGMEYEDIARIMGSNETTVRQMVSRARRAVRDKYIKYKLVGR